MLRGLLVGTLVLAGAGVGAEEPRFTEQITPGGTHEAGDAKWSVELFRAATVLCPKSKPGDCVRNVVRVRNDSGKPMQCSLSLTLPRKDDSGRKRLEQQFVIFAGNEGRSSPVYGPVDLVPTRFEATCAVLPSSMEPLDVPVECRGQLTVPPIADFYPPNARRRGEQGDIVLEYGVAPRSKELQDVRVVASSGFAELDTAALVLSRYVATRRQCPGLRYRVKIRFEFRNDRPAS